ncbi:MAG TPA: NAD-dependent epimerase/dehydratase family protein [Acidimicrobiales bacterium]|nr:NAD-dependent epimerase/dehydratase family protein [Acidimicrobiales bacterium]
MRALVTGGAGFIGSTLVDRLLAEGHEVDVVDDLSTGSLANLATARHADGALRFQRLDVRAPELVELMTMRRPEVIFHIAAQISVSASVKQPLFDADVNVLGTVRVLEGARACAARKVVFAASGGTLYGDVDPADLPITEQHEQRPQSPYGLSKKIGCDYLRLYRELYGLEFTALALANVYGPRQDPHGEAGVVAIFAEALLAGEAPAIDGDGEQTRDFVYVDDVVDAFSRAATRGSGLICNIGTGRQTSVNDLYRAIAAAAGSDIAPRHGPARQGDVRASALDPGRASIHLGWRSWTEVPDGVAAVIAAMRGGPIPGGGGASGGGAAGGGASGGDAAGAGGAAGGDAAGVEGRPLGRGDAGGNRSGGLG